MLWNKNAKLVILFFWVFGLLIGGQFCRGDPAMISSLMHTAMAGCVSIVGLFCVLFLPLFVAALAVYRSIPVLLLVAIGGKAISFGFVFTSVDTWLGNASWLIRFFLLFTDCVGIAALIWLSLRHASHRLPSFWVDLTGCICICLMAATIDYWLISPFAASLVHG